MEPNEQLSIAGGAAITLPIGRALGTRLRELLAEANLSAEAKRVVLLSASPRVENYPESNGPVEWELSDTDGAISGNVWLESIRVAGFRGIGPQSLLPLKSGPGLTLIVGRNGSGKSSFAEAVEVSLTGTNSRWRDKTKVWSESWRNLHHSANPEIGLEFQVEKAGPVEIRTSWENNDVDSAETTVTFNANERLSWEELGWDVPLDLSPPFLSYNELGKLLDQKPSEMFDAINGMLGLEHFTEMTERVGQWRLDAQSIGKNLKVVSADLIEELEVVGDVRATTAIEIIKSRKPDLQAAAELAVGDGGENLDPYGGLARIAGPNLEACTTASEALQDAMAKVAEVGQSDAARDEHLAALLEQALQYRSEEPSIDCPLCKVGQLDTEWADAASSQVQDLRQRSTAYTNSAKALETARRAAIRQIVPVPTALISAPEVEGLEAAIQQWTEWAATPSELDNQDLIARLEGANEVTACVQKVVDAAKQELEQQADEWRPHALALSNWVELANEAIDTEPLIDELKAAEEFLKASGETLRNERYEPIRQEATNLWGTLRQSSNVQLEDITLERSGNQRKVQLKVTVDGTETSALGVMSQGELHSLALALFLPRATSDASPFRFVVIDDPVQAMDPSKVEGLARVLSQVAAHRQVVVFTHDERLPAACRRLALDHTQIEVDRKTESRVALREVTDPVTQLLNDVESLAKGKGIPENIKPNIVPVQCRLAIEACARELAWSRMLASGHSHLEVESALDDAKTTADALGVLMFGKSGDPRDVYDALDRVSEKASKTIKWINRSAHSPSNELFNAAGLVSGTRHVVHCLRENWA